MKVSRKYKRLRPVYDHFGRAFTDLDFSDEAFEEMYRYESSGGETPDKSNGYFQAKRMIDITVAAWREDVGSPFLPREELYSDPNYPEWWLNKVLPPPDLSHPFKRHPLLDARTNDGSISDATRALYRMIQSQTGGTGDE